MRQILEEECPESLLAELTDEQRASIEAGPTLARFLSAKLVTAAASSKNPRDTFAALSLVAQIDSRHGDGFESTGEISWRQVFERLPSFLQNAIVCALDTIDPNNLNAPLNPDAELAAIRGFVESLSYERREIADHLMRFGYDALERSPVTLREVIDQMTDEDLRQQIELNKRVKAIYERLKAESTSAA